MACKLIRFPGGGGAIACGPRPRMKRTDKDRDVYARVVLRVEIYPRKLVFGQPPLSDVVDTLECGHERRYILEGLNVDVKSGQTIFCDACHKEATCKNKSAK
jgi:hypothetical protein